jgi:glycosyltransferase involved in cell wall biosynthesis
VVTVPVAVRLAVVVPAFDEEHGIGATLAALAGQRDTAFELVVVDNLSTDATVGVVERFAEAAPFGVHLVTETRKGTGAAADTGVREAISRGATHVLRCDADTLPRHDWTANARRWFAAGDELLTGPMLPRTDEFPLRLWERTLVPLLVPGAAVFGRYRPSNRGADEQGRPFRGPYVMCPGCNLGVSARAYEASGGFPRTAIEEVHEDRALVNRVRVVSERVAYRRDVVVRASARRLRAYGLRATLRWYLDHGHTPDVVDVRLAAGP